MTYRLVTTTAAGIVYPGIECLICGRTSWNRHDIEFRYCGACHRFHDDPLPRGTSQTSDEKSQT